MPDSNRPSDVGASGREAPGGFSIVLVLVGVLAAAVAWLISGSLLAAVATLVVAPTLLWLLATWSGPGRFTGGDFLSGG